MKKMLYTKFNRTRDPRFQTSTQIYTEDGRKYVNKSALTDEAKTHIVAYKNKYDLNRKLYKNIIPLRGEWGESSVIFPYVEGVSAKSILDEKKSDFSELCKEIEDCFSGLFAYNDELLCEFEYTQPFGEVFGCDNEYKGQAVAFADIDVIFDNVIMRDGKWVAIDYEWTFDFPIPTQFIMYRRLYWFFHNEQTYFDGKITEMEFFTRFGLTEQMCEIFSEWEKNFQFYVYGKQACYAYPSRYQKETIEFKKLVYEHGNLERAFTEEAARQQVLREQVQEREDVIREKNVKILEMGDGWHQTKLDLNAVNQTLEESKIQLRIKQVELNDTKTELNDTKTELNNSYEVLSNTQRVLEDYQNMYESLTASMSWKITAPIRKFLHGLKWIGGKIKKVGMLLTMILKQPKLIGYGLKFAKQHGIKQFYGALASISNDNIVIENPKREIKPSYSGDILFSILMPVYNVDLKWLEVAIQSVESQNYLNWELCIVDDCSTDKDVRKYLSGIKNEKIKIVLAEENSGISGATNKAAEIASGDYYLLMDNDDEIASDALDEFYQCIKNANPDIIYSDQDIVDIKGYHREPLYKPDWSPDLFLSQMYMGHLIGFRKELFERVGGFRSEYNGSQDYDLLLRMTLETQNIAHIPKILYSWRDIPSSTAANPESKPYAQTAGLNALQSFLDEKYGQGYAIASETENLFTYDVRYSFNENNKIAIIIPTKDHVELLQVAIDSIEKLTTYENYHILILNNNSEEQETFDYFKQVIKKYDNVAVEDALFEFNWSKLNNYGVSKIDADIYVFLNNDVKILEPEWLRRLAEKATRKEVGVVGGLLLYEDDTIQHAGVVVGMGGWAEHVYKAMKPIHCGTPYISPMVTRNVTAVTGACLAVSKETLNLIGPFDEDFIICGSDIELGIRAVQYGLYNIYDPYVRMYHYESKSRDSYVPEIDFKMSYEVYTPYRENGDPFYNNNLDYYVYQPQVKSFTVIRNQEQENVVEDDAVSKRILNQKQMTVDDVKIPEINPYKFRHVEIDRKRINLLVPSINPEHVFGGISTAIKFYMQLADALGYDQRMILVDALPSDEGLKQYPDFKLVSANTDSNAKKQIVSYALRDLSGIPVSSTDYFMFTGWWTAHCTQEAYELFEKECGIRANPYIYFIQDYEPGFYAWSTKYMLADATYKIDNEMIAIFNSLLLKEYFDKNGYCFEHVYAFEPVLNANLKEELLKLPECINKNKQILIYGRPSTDRNAFSLVIAGLNKWARDYSGSIEWDVYSAGEEHLDVVLENGVVVKSVGKLTIQEYAQTLAESYAGISLMVSPHPSYPPLEMATYGVRVITNAYSNKDLTAFNSNILSLNAVNPSTIAKSLCDICEEYQEVVHLTNRRNSYTDNENVFSFITDIKKVLN